MQGGPSVLCTSICGPGWCGLLWLPSSCSGCGLSSVGALWFLLFGDTGGPGACSSLPLRPCPLPPPLNCLKLLAGECVLCASFHGVCAERPSLFCLGTHPSRLTHFPPETFGSPAFSGTGPLSFSTLLFLLSYGHKVISLAGCGLLHRTAHASLPLLPPAQDNA